MSDKGIFGWFVGMGCVGVIAGIVFWGAIIWMVVWALKQFF